MSIAQASERLDLVKQAFWLEWITIASLGIVWFLVKEGREAWASEALLPLSYVLRGL